jgi:hypothetical protein
MNVSVAQLTGAVVTSIVVFGADSDIVTALPLGIFAGLLAALFLAIAERRTAPAKR